jgi:Fe-S oxidoreductase
MAVADVKPDEFFGETFKQSIFELADAERIRTCIQCGTCSGVCPFRNWMDLAPHQMVRILREEKLDRASAADTVWLCVSCYACAENCPQEIPLTTQLIRRTREELLLSGNIPQELQTALQNSQRYGNSNGESPRKRELWARETSPPVALMSRLRRPVDILWYVGDYTSYHPRVKKSAQALAKILTALKVDFAILGREEVSDGDSQRLAGEVGLFESLAEKNGHMFNKYDFNEIITTDPHAYNALKNEYPRLGFSFPVRHYTEFLVDHVAELKPLLVKEVNALATYHDPCYLGRANGIYDEPRMLLDAVPGLVLVEMAHNRSHSLCCGNGGGGLWLQGFQWEKTGNRLSEWRIREAIRAVPEKPFASPVGFKEKRKAYRKEKTLPETRILAVACPYEAPCFEEAAKLVPEAKDLLVMDISEILEMALAD